MTQKQILIVEDNELNRAMLSEILSDSYLILAAVQMGYTEAEAIELIKVYALFDIAHKLDGISF